MTRHPFPRASERGFALVTVAIICLVVGLVALDNMRATIGTQRLAGNSIERSRAIQAAVGASVLAERTVAEEFARRVFADGSATQGVYALGTSGGKWWRAPARSGDFAVDEDELLGVKTPPRFVVEQIGVYSSDGGTGIANLDRGGSAYGQLTSSGRDYVIYRTEAAAAGVRDGSYSVVETINASSY